MTRQLFEGIKVLELGTMVGVPYSGKIFADYGADVLKVEPLEGDPSRSEGPFLKDIPNKETSALFLHLNTNIQLFVYQTSKYTIYSAFEEL